MGHSFSSGLQTDLCKDKWRIELNETNGLAGPREDLPRGQLSSAISNFFSHLQAFLNYERLGRREILTATAWSCQHGANASRREANFLWRLATVR